MAINFTDSPSNGDTQTINGRTYTYNSAKNKWDTTATEVAGPTATVYATVNDLPGSATAGDQAFVSGTNRLYIWNGSGWYNIALVNNTPTWTNQPNSSYALATDGTATTITIVAADPEGLPITYSIASDTSGDIATVTQGTGQQSNTWTITPSTSNADAGTFSLTFRASDGINVASAVSEFTLVFRVTNSNYTTALITTSGSAGTNSSFTDSSSNSRTITANGNTTQTSFSPYRSGGYSTLVGTSDAADYLSIAQDASINSLYSGDYTIEFWFNKQSERTQNFILSKGGGTTREWGIAVQSTAVIIYWSTNGASSGDASVSLSTTIDLNKWYHLAVTFDSVTNTITVYLNGSSLGTGTFTSIYGGTGTLYIGKFMDYGAISHSCHAYITDLRVVKGTAVYTAAFTPPDERLTAITNTSLLACHLPYIADGSTNNHTITPNGNVSTKPFAPYDYQEYVVGDHGGSAYFDGAGDYLLSTGESFDTGDFAVEAWLYPTALGGDKCWYDSRDTNTSNGMVLFINSSGLLSCYSSGSLRLTSSKALKPNTWHHVAFVRNNGTIYWFIDGSLSNSASYSSTIAAPGGFKIGARNDTAANFIGYISNFRAVRGTAVYTSAFTPPTAPLTAITNTSLLLNMQGAKILDKSQSTQNLTLVGNTTASTAQYKYLPTSMYFDGIGDYINLNEAVIPTDASTDWTIEFWFNVPSSSTRYDFICQYAASVAGRMTINSTTSGEIMFFQNGLSVAPLTSTDTFTANTWNHVAVVNNGQTRTLYLNGVSQGTATGTSSMQDANTVIGALTSNPISNYLEGYIEDLRITKGLARYTANFTPPSAALQG